MEIVWRILLVLTVAGCFGMGAYIAQQKDRIRALEAQTRRLEIYVYKQSPESAVSRSEERLPPEIQRVLPASPISQSAASSASPWVAIGELNTQIKNLQRTDRDLRAQIGGYETDLNGFKHEFEIVRGFEQRILDNVQEVNDGTRKHITVEVNRFKGLIQDSEQRLRQDLGNAMNRMDSKSDVNDRAIISWIDNMRKDGRFTADLAPTNQPTIEPVEAPKAWEKP